MGNKLYDVPYLTILDKTVVDSSSLNGHSVVYGDVSLGPTIVKGILHEGTTCLGNSNLSANVETMPYHFVTPSLKPCLADDVLSGTVKSGE